MSHHVTVAFGEEREYEFVVSDAEVSEVHREEARAWLADQFEDLECAPTNPMGKILVLDMVLNVAKYGGEARFKERGDWADKFALMTAAALQRTAIRVDVAGFVVG